MKLLNSNDYDIRKSHNARFMDQKVTPDVLSFIADCTLNKVAGNIDSEFTVKDIWISRYFVKNVKAILNKPEASNPTAESEYDKFIQQPLKMLSYARVISCKKRGTTNYFLILEEEILNFIADSPGNAYRFLYLYILKVLSDSNQLQHFEKFKEKCKRRTVTKNDFANLKTRFEKFIIGNTLTNGLTEVRKIFPKVLNVYASFNVINGSLGGHLSKYTYYYTDLMYNNTNWRDVGKDKNLTRKESASQIQDMHIEPSKEYLRYLIQKRKQIIRDKYNISEIKDQFSSGDASHVHHIFPLNEFPQLSWYLENLIKLTPTQHLSKAHPKGNTTIVDRDYQLTCLLAKSDSIEFSIRKHELIYSKESFVHVINTGLSENFATGLNFGEIKNNLVTLYSSL